MGLSSGEGSNDPTRFGERNSGAFASTRSRLKSPDNPHVNSPNQAACFQVPQNTTDIVAPELAVYAGSIAILELARNRAVFVSIFENQTSEAAPFGGRPATIYVYQLVVYPPPHPVYWNQQLTGRGQGGLLESITYL